MTENEIVKQAIRCIVGACDETCKGYDANKYVCHGYSEVASGLETVLKDYEQYRAIGTIDEFKALKEKDNKDFELLLKAVKESYPMFKGAYVELDVFMGDVMRRFTRDRKQS